MLHEIRLAIDKGQIDLMRNLILGLILVISPLFLTAHNPLSSTYYLEVNEDVNILNIYLSQAGLNKAIIKKYSKEKVDEMSIEGYKQVLVDYLKDNFQLVVNGERIELLEGGIKLGNHQTDLKFVVSSFPLEIQKVFIEIPAFQENDHHQTIFSYNLYGEVDKVILREENDYKAEILFGEQPKSWVIIGALMILLLVIVVVRKR